MAFTDFTAEWADDMMLKNNKTAILNVAKFVCHASNLRKLNIV